ncbi:MAG: transporter substrate-binding domain-containing protein, partial [Parvibaculum sp.]|nr:transporter substrate-binding domain-containing protein [Parvibaculum sp.]
GALARLYEGAPLPWAEARLERPAPAATTPSAVEAPQPSAPISIDLVVALQLPLPNPERTPADAAPRRFRLLTEGDYPPFNYRDETGALAGFDVELAGAICERLKAVCSFEARSWGQLLPALKSGEGDAVIASLLIPVPGRESPAADGEIVFTDSYYSTPGRFAARKSGTVSSTARAGRRIAVQAGSVHQAFALSRFSNARLLAFPTPERAATALSDGEADLLFGDRNALLRWTSGAAGACCRLVGPDYADPAYFGQGAGIAFRAGDAALRDEFDTALSALVADGTYARISARYFTASIY